MNSIKFTHLLSPLGLVAWQQHQPFADHARDRSPDPSRAAAVVRSLVGGLPLDGAPADPSGDAKPRRYSSELPGAAVT